MKRVALLFLLFFLISLAAGWTGPPPANEVRNVRLRPQVAGDSLLYRLQWNAPQRGPGQTPIEGYEWETWISTNDSINREGTLDSLVASGATAATDQRRIDGAYLVSSCPMTVNGVETTVAYLGAYVRATGQFSEPAPWGKSAPVEIGCTLDDSPPPAPTVTLDTIPRDTATSPPDSIVAYPVDLGLNEWDGENLRFTALNSTVRVCGFAYRGHLPYLMDRGDWVTTMDSTEVVQGSATFEITSAPPVESACWYWRSIATGSGEAFLCSTDCGASLAGLRFLPSWAAGPLLVLGVLVFLYGMARERRVRRKRDDDPSF